ncbi:MAG: L-threonylcarbamoyladenylate synthase [Halothece sp.]
MATVYSIHPETPQERILETVAQDLKKGAILLYPTDTVYAIGCDLSVKSAVERVRSLKRLSNEKPLTFLCSSLSNIAAYALVSDEAYRLMKRLIPGTYTFLLPATKAVPRLVMNPKRKTTGIRVPNHTLCQSLLKTLGNPIISTSAYLRDDEGELSTLDYEKARLFDELDKLVDIILDDGSQDLQTEVSTIIDLTGKQPKIIREGLGIEEAENWI